MEVVVSGVVVVWLSLRLSVMLEMVVIEVVVSEMVVEMEMKVEVPVVGSSMTEESAMVESE